MRILVYLIGIVQIMTTTYAWYLNTTHPNNKYYEDNYKFELLKGLAIVLACHFILKVL